jgi:hypothetical protein
MSLNIAVGQPQQLDYGVVVETEAASTHAQR